MSVPLNIRSTQPYRIVPVRFRRADYGDPVQIRPEVDDRGYANTEHTTIVGIKENTTVILRIKRANIDPATPVFVTSADAASLSIVKPSGGALPAADEMDFSVKAGKGSNPKAVKIDVRIGSATGIIVHTLTAWIFSELKVSVTPHLVEITDDPANDGIKPSADVNAIMAKVKEIWANCGLTIKVEKTWNDSIVLKTKGIVSDTPYPGELDTVCKNNPIASTINVYFVNQIGTKNVLGYGFSRDSASSNKMTNPCIFLGDKTATVARSGMIHYANDLAHEIGHFFQLWHPENKQPPNEREDTWSRRKLMHNFNGMLPNSPWPSYMDYPTNTVPYANRPAFDDAGYGNRRRGCMITMKKLSQLVTDGDVTTARQTIQSAKGPY